MEVSKNSYKTWVEVDKEALTENARIVRGLLGTNTRLMAVVKSNAYGHGLIETAKIFSKKSANWLGVDNVDEAICLRKVGVKVPIMVLGYTSSEMIKTSNKYNLRFTVYESGIIDDFSKIRSKKSKIPKFHIKIDTGMSRQGVTIDDLPNFLKSIPKNFDIEGILSHLANADNLSDRTFPDFQLGEFNRALIMFKDCGFKPKIKHISATTGLLTLPQESQLDMVRVGIALYGLWPSPEFREKFNSPGHGLGIVPALSWKTRIAQIKKIKAGTSVGYGVTEKVDKDSVIAVLPVGYYDGYFRKLSSAAEVLVGGKRCKILGRISMNLSVVDISVAKNPRVLDEVVLIGKQGGEEITAEELAEKAETISYEVVSRINPLLPRFYI